MFKSGLGGMMKKAQEMQENMKRVQEELAHKTVEGQAGALSLASLWQQIDGISAATLLDAGRMARIDDKALPRLFDGQALNIIAVNAAWILGGLWLCIKRYADWRIVFSVLTGALLSAWICHVLSPVHYLDTFSQLFAGAILFGAFFIATDPVTAPATPPGRIIYGLLIGILTVLIRNLGNFPDGFAFAVLLANALVPLIDPLTRPRYR